MTINKQILAADLERNKQKLSTPAARDILPQLLAGLEYLDFTFEVTTKTKDGKEERKEIEVKQKHAIVMIIDAVLTAAQAKEWPLCRRHDFLYIFNGKYWAQIDKDEVKSFLGEAAEKLGYNILESRYFEFRDKLYKQFLCAAVLPAPENENGKILVNLVNGTFEITPARQHLREHAAADFLRYILPFGYDPGATCPTFDQYLKRVLPDPSARAVLAEYIGWVFLQGIPGFKLEKFLLLYGSGANGKSVFFEVVNALLGRENITNYSLASLGEEHNRAQLADKLLNYGSEIRAGIDADQLKALASGEPVQARLKYGNSFMLENYARLAFNCNELPREVEFNEAYFRRFLIIPFAVTIPETERDPSLAQRIIDNELPGVFNWILAGLRRLLANGNFTECKAAKDVLSRYRQESDSAFSFIDDNRYKPSFDDKEFFKLKELYAEYRAYCLDCGFRPLSIKSFAERLRNHGFETKKRNTGQIVFAEKIESDASGESDAGKNIFFSENGEK